MHVWHAIGFATMHVSHESHSAHTAFFLNHGRAARIRLGVDILPEGLCVFLLYASLL